MRMQVQRRDGAIAGILSRPRLNGGAWPASRSGRFTPGKDPVRIVEEETGWESGPVCYANPLFMMGISF
jgi:hypothetical protein